MSECRSSEVLGNYSKKKIVFFLNNATMLLALLSVVVMFSTVNVFVEFQTVALGLTLFRW